MITSTARKIALATATSAALILLVSTSAYAAPGDAIGLSAGTNGSSTVVISVPLLGTPNVVPGDSGERTISVRNEGESAGTLTADIVNVTLAHDATDPFYVDLLINARPVIELLGQETHLLTTELAVGASAPVSLSYEFPLEATSGIDPNDLLQAHVDVRFTLEGDAGGLASTGSDIGSLALGGAVLGGALIAGGASIIVVERRHRETNHSTS
jgi:hypothetical protein